MSDIRSAGDVAREVVHTGQPGVSGGDLMVSWSEDQWAAAVDLIRARDAEVRADERAKVRQWLAEYTGPDPMVGLGDLRKILAGEEP